ncbi:MAG: exosortase [Anaerolineae bacterium]|nr:exosortase [Anaerolineae bacterium]
MTTQSTNRTPWWQWIGALFLVLAAYRETLRWLVVSWLGSPYYSHGFLVPLISVGLALWIERQPSRPLDSQNRKGKDFCIGLLIVSLAMALHLYASRHRHFLLSALTLPAALGGLILALGRGALLKRQAFPLIFLLFMIPLPWLEQSTPWLSRTVASAVAALVRPVGIAVTAAGARIQLTGTALTIGAPCSGVNSLAALVTLATLYAFVSHCRLSARVLIVVLSVPIALLANLVRVLAILLLAHYVNLDLALGFFHDWSSPFLFLVAIGLLVVISRGLGCRGLRFDSSR